MSMSEQVDLRQHLQIPRVPYDGRGSPRNSVPWGIGLAIEGAWIVWGLLLLSLGISSPSSLILTLKEVGPYPLRRRGTRTSGPLPL